jgi:hypothetical protein
MANANRVKRKWQEAARIRRVALLAAKLCAVRELGLLRSPRGPGNHTECAEAFRAYGAVQTSSKGLVFGAQQMHRGSSLPSRDLGQRLEVVERCCLFHDPGDLLAGD